MRSLFLFCVLATAALAAAPRAALAGEGFFSRLYTTDTTPAGGLELEQITRWRTGRTFGTYSAFDFRSEVEYGFTDNFQGALYLNYGQLHAVGAPDDDDPNGATGFSRDKFYFQSVSAEFIYRLLSPITSPVGLAFYVEPEYAYHDVHNALRYNRTFGLETRLILQKNFLDDTLILAYNMVAEFEFIRFMGREEENWKGELDWNHELGASYRFAPNWFVGLEARNHNELGDFFVHEHSVYWAGPVLHYGGEKLWATLGVLRQVYGDPHGRNAEGENVGDHNLFTRSHEKWETTLKIGVPL